MGVCHYLVDACETCAGMRERILRSFPSLSNFLLETVNTDALMFLPNYDNCASDLFSTSAHHFFVH